MDRLGDVLDLMLAQRVELQGKLVIDVLDDGTRNRDAAGLGQLLQTRGNIHALAVAVLALDDHVAEIDAHARVDALVFGEAIVAPGHGALERDRAFHHIDDTAELGQQPVAHQLEDAAVMLLDLRLEQFLAVHPEPLERAGLVRLHEPAVAGDVGGKDSGEATFHGGYFSGAS
jgi:hypothetical protein